MAFEFGDWLVPNGLECPVDLHAVVEIERREGTTAIGPAGSWSSPQRYQNSWWHNGGNCDVVRYRRVYFTDETSKSKAERAGCCE